MAVEDSLAHRNHQLLKEILEQLQTLNATFDSFTNDGFPLAQAMPTPELLASLLAAAALIAKDQPRVTTDDLRGRVAAAQVLATELLSQHDRFQTETRKGRLNQLAHD
jgi:hypothetical protein